MSGASKHIDTIQRVYIQEIQQKEHEASGLDEFQSYIDMTEGLLAEEHHDELLTLIINNVTNFNSSKDTRRGVEELINFPYLNRIIAGVFVDKLSYTASKDFAKYQKLFNNLVSLPPDVLNEENKKIFLKLMVVSGTDAGKLSSLIFLFKNQKDPEIRKQIVEGILQIQGKDLLLNKTTRSDKTAKNSISRQDQFINPILVQLQPLIPDKTEFDAFASDFKSTLLELESDMLAKTSEEDFEAIIEANNSPELLLIMRGMSNQNSAYTLLLKQIQNLTAKELQSVGKDANAEQRIIDIAEKKCLKVAFDVKFNHGRLLTSGISVMLIPVLGPAFLVPFVIGYALSWYSAARTRRELRKNLHVKLAAGYDYELKTALNMVFTSSKATNYVDKKVQLMRKISEASSEMTDISDIGLTAAGVDSSFITYLRSIFKTTTHTKNINKMLTRSELMLQRANNFETALPNLFYFSRQNRVINALAYFTPAFRVLQRNDFDTYVRMHKHEIRLQMRAQQLPVPDNNKRPSLAQRALAALKLRDSEDVTNLLNQLYSFEARSVLEDIQQKCIQQIRIESFDKHIQRNASKLFPGKQTLSEEFLDNLPTNEKEKIYFDFLKTRTKNISSNIITSLYLKPSFAAAFVTFSLLLFTPLSLFAVPVAAAILLSGYMLSKVVVLYKGNKLGRELDAQAKQEGSPIHTFINKSSNEFFKVYADSHKKKAHTSMDEVNNKFLSHYQNSNQAKSSKDLLSEQKPASRFGRFFKK